MEGITRRIDELGRIVVPKEIRNALRLAEGSIMEFSVNQDKLILQKFAPLTPVEEMINVTVDSLKKFLNMTVAIVWENQIFVKSGKDNIPIDKLDLTKRMYRSRSIAIEGDMQEYTIMPMIVRGDLIGNIVVVGNLDEVKAQVVKFVAQLICDYYPM